MGWLYNRKQKKKFFDSHASILVTLRDLAYAAAHGHMGHDQLIRLGERANRLVAKHGHLMTTMDSRGKLHGLWPAPRNGFPKPKQPNTAKTIEGGLQ